MSKDVDLSEGEPVVKDPPLHRLIRWVEKSCGWGTLILVVLWAGAITLITLPLIGVITGWDQQNGNAAASLVIGCIVGLISVAGTFWWIWDLEEQKIGDRIRAERQLMQHEYYMGGTLYHVPQQPQAIQQQFPGWPGSGLP